MRRLTAVYLGVLLLLFTSVSPADETADPSPQGPAVAPSDDLAEHESQLREQLSGCRLVGYFTLGQDDGQPALKPDRYEILSLEKLPAGDLWLFTARVQYGDKDLTLPMPLPIQWAGKTPVITLDQLTIPGLGTFDARVVISGDRYAGTWQHGDAGGHLFGRIERMEKAAPDPR
jgi:hypothetical protein